MSVKMPSNGGEPSKNRLEGLFADRGLDRNLEQQPKQPEAPSLAEQVKKIRAEVQAAEQRAQDVGKRLTELAERNDNPRLKELKQRSNNIIAAIQGLNADMVKVLLGEAPIESVAQDAESLVKSSGNLFFEEQKQQAAANEQERQKRSVAFIEQNFPTPAPVTPEAPAVEAQPAATPDTATPAAEAKTQAEPQSEPQAEPQAEARAEDYDRTAFWSELKDKMGDRSQAEIPFRQTVKQLEKIQKELREAAMKLAESEQAEQTPESLIDEIAKLHLSLGGKERSDEVRSELERLMKTKPGRAFFSHPVGPMRFVPMKSKFGKDGLSERVAALQAEAKKSSKLGSMFEKVKALAGLSELRSLESRKRQQEAALTVQMDQLISLVQTMNTRDSLQEREIAMEKDKEALAMQLGYDTELFGMIETGEALTKDIEQTKRKLEQFLARLDETPAKAKLKEGYPSPMPEEVAHFLTPQQTEEYNTLSQRYHTLQQELNAHIDATKELVDNGIAGYNNRQLEKAAQKEAEALAAAAQAEADKLASAAEAEQAALAEAAAKQAAEEAVLLEKAAKKEARVLARAAAAEASEKAKAGHPEQSAEWAEARKAYFTETSEKLREVLMKHLPENADNITYLMGVPFEDEDEQGEIEKELGNYLQEPARRVIKEIFANVDSIRYGNKLDEMKAKMQRRNQLQRLDRILGRRVGKELPEGVEVVNESTGKTAEEQLKESKAAIAERNKERAFYPEMAKLVGDAEAWLAKQNRKHHDLTSAASFWKVPLLKQALEKQTPRSELTNEEREALEQAMNQVDAMITAPEVQPFKKMPFSKKEGKISRDRAKAAGTRPRGFNQGRRGGGRRAA